VLYVDDILVLYADEASGKAADIKNRLMQHYKMKNLGPAKQFLGLEIERLPVGSITLGQSAYVASMLKKFDMTVANTVNTPLHHKIRLDETSSDTEADARLYQSIVSIMYAALGTRPDIAFAVGALSRYNGKPKKTRLTAAKRVLRYHWFSQAARHQAA